VQGDGSTQVGQLLAGAQRQPREPLIHSLVDPGARGPGQRAFQSGRDRVRGAVTSRLRGCAALSGQKLVQTGTWLSSEIREELWGER